MKVPVIRKLVREHGLDEIKKAEDDILNERNISIDMPGDDPGEKLTNVLAAKAILKEMEEHGVDEKIALKNFIDRVRKSTE